jgi:uncharacterized protein (DUF2336 family)
VIVDRGDARVLNTVTRNLGARFSDAGFANLAEKSTGDFSLSEALSFRGDMPVAVANTLVARLSPVARQRLRHLMAQDRDKLDALFAEARREVGNSRQDHRRNRIECKVMLADLRDGKRGLDDVLDELIFKKRLVDIAFIFAELAGVPEAHVNNVLHKVNSTGIAVICRTLEVAGTVYDRLCRLRCERLRLNVAQIEPMLRDYHALDKPNAERALRFHKVRSAVNTRSA